MITVLAAPPLLTVQDQGRPGARASGVPVAGAMDPLALAAANLLVGNPPDAAGLEWALGGGSIRFERAAWFALGGATAPARLEGVPVAPGLAHVATPGSVLEIGQFTSGTFLYVALEGGIDVPVVLGSRSTYLPARLGGLEGRRLRAGDRLPLGPRGAGPGSGPVLRERAAPGEPVPLLRGPAADLLDAAGWEQLLGAEFRVTASVSRMGYRLEGPALACHAASDRVSEPTVPGAVQVPPGGQPIILMADGPTIGGYPHVAVIPRLDLGRVAQLRPGESLRFALITTEQARHRLRDTWRELHTPPLATDR
ncbi:MAG: biotin-dependent carboxyltransferase family protein [Gemmatimonadota bacterium]